MVARAAISTYRRTAVETADVPRLILLAYEGAIQALAEAEESLAARDYLAKGKSVARAREFVSELLAGINPEAGPLAANLKSLYVYMLQTLVLFEPQTEFERIKRVRHLIEELHVAWKTVIERPQPLEVSPRAELKEATV